MLTQEDDVEIHALRKKGWSISAIARHTGRDRKTVRAYLEGRGGRDTRPQERPSGVGLLHEWVTGLVCSVRPPGGRPEGT